jgi:hypothetical protein
MNRPDRVLWLESMSLKNENVLTNKVLELVPQNGQRCLLFKPIFKI